MPNDAATQPTPTHASPAPLDAAWDRYMATLAEMRAAIDASPQLAHAPDQRGKGYHALLEAQAIAYNFAIAPRLDRPRIFHNTAWQTHLYTLGGNGPEFHYGVAFLHGGESYRITGRANDSRLLLAQLNSALPGSPGARLMANYDFSDFELAADGSFELLLSATAQPGNWIPLDPDSGYQWILFRPQVPRLDATPAELTIERLGPVDQERFAAADFDETAIAARIDAASAFIRYMTVNWSVGFWVVTARDGGGVNHMCSIGAQDAGEVGSPSAQYINGTFELEPDEALIVTIPEVPDGPYWGIQLFDVWLRSSDFASWQTSLSDAQTARDADGRIRYVISHRDPGVANWLDATGHRQGQICHRKYHCRVTALPTITRVKLAELWEHLPADTARVTPEGRAAALAERRAAYLRRHGE